MSVMASPLAYWATLHFPQVGPASARGQPGNVKAKTGLLVTDGILLALPSPVKLLLWGARMSSVAGGLTR